MFCRMLNADGIVGSTGELLSHNMFAYSKNNPVNMSDPSGFRPIFDHEETKEMKAASFAIMNGQPVSYVAPKKKRAIDHVDKVLELSGKPTGQAAVATGNAAIGVGVGNYVGKIVDQTYKTVKSSVVLIGHKMPSSIEYFKYDLSMSRSIGKVSSAIGAAGLLSIGLLGLQVYSNVYHYGLAEGVGRTGIDALGFAAGCGVGAILAASTVGFGGGVLIGIGASFIIGGAVNKAKEYFFE